MSRASGIKLAAWRATNRALRPIGYELQPSGEVPRLSPQRALENVRRLGVQLATVIDVGAAYGDWSRECAAVFPNAQYLLVEPLAELRDFVTNTVDELDSATHFAVAAGANSGTAPLYVHEDLGGSSLRHEHEDELELEERTTEIRTVDSLVDEVGATGPYLLKVDVQGAELDVLAGATATLRSTELVVLEVSFLDFFENSASFAEIVAFMVESGFSVYDLLGVAYRPLDGALAQADLLFARSSGPLRASLIYADAEARAVQTARFRAAHDQRIAARRRQKR